MSRSTPTEYAPAAIAGLFDELVRLAGDRFILGGIVGDRAHVYGYHRARAVLPDTDYSCQLPRDRGGDPWAASAIDITPRDAADVQLLTSRLLRAVQRGDKRLHPVREFFGTVDGDNVTGWDRATGRPSTSDRTHLWHVHVSIFRDANRRTNRLLDLARLLAGERDHRSR